MIRASHGAIQDLEWRKREHPDSRVFMRAEADRKEVSTSSKPPRLGVEIKKEDLWYKAKVLALSFFPFPRHLKW